MFYAPVYHYLLFTQRLLVTDNERLSQHKLVKAG
jgi:hypothetical protein